MDTIIIIAQIPFLILKKTSIEIIIIIIIFIIIIFIIHSIIIAIKIFNVSIVFCNISITETSPYSFGNFRKLSLYNCFMTI